MGSLVALEAAFRAQAIVNRLVLLGAAVPMPVADPLLHAARANDHGAVDMIMLYSHAYASQLGGNPVAGIKYTQQQYAPAGTGPGKRPVCRPQGLP